MSRGDDSSVPDGETSGSEAEKSDWGPWALVGGVALVGAAAVAHGVKKRLRNANQRE